MCGGQVASAQLRAHELLAIADAEHRHAHLEHLLGRERRRLFVHRGRTARQDDALRRERGELFLAHVEGVDLAIDAALAQPPRDELRHLAAEIEDEDAVCHRGFPILPLPLSGEGRGEDGSPWIPTVGPVARSLTLPSPASKRERAPVWSPFGSAL